MFPTTTEQQYFRYVCVYKITHAGVGDDSRRRVKTVVTRVTRQCCRYYHLVTEIFYRNT